MSGSGTGRTRTGSRNRRTSRGVALVNALVVVAALAAISAAVLVRADHARQRQSLRGTVDQAAAYVQAGQDQALAELVTLLARQPPGPLLPGQGWDLPRQVPIDRGELGWTFADLQGRFNLTWLSDEGDWGAFARESFGRLAESLGLEPPLIARLIRATGPEGIARAAAFGVARSPEMPLASPRLLAAVARAQDGGPGALAPLWPHLAALPAGTGFNPETAPLPVLQALLPGIDPADWVAFEAARQSGELAATGGTQAHAARFWPEAASETLARLPVAEGPDWLELTLEARLDSRALRRSLVIVLEPPQASTAPALVVPGAPFVPRVHLSLPLPE